MIYGIANKAQFDPLVWSVMIGVVCGILWDVFRFFRQLIPAGRIRLFAEDVFFFIVWAILTFLLCYVTNYGKIRGYILLMQPIGFFLWYCLPGRFTLRFAHGCRIAFFRFAVRPYLQLCSKTDRIFRKTKNKISVLQEKKRKKQKNIKKNNLKMQKRTCKQKKDNV